MGMSLLGALGTLDSIVMQALNSGNAPVLIVLGSFQFSLNTAVYKEIKRSTSYRWANVEQFGWVDAKQFTGFGDDTITIPCFVYPDWLQNGGSVSQLKQMAQAGKPYRLMSGNGNNAGMWVIKSIEETRSEFKSDGTYRKQEFTLTIEFYAPSVSN
jgi:phage protein U